MHSCSVAFLRNLCSMVILVAGRSSKYHIVFNQYNITQETPHNVKLLLSDSAAVVKRNPDLLLNEITDINTYDDGRR